MKKRTTVINSILSLAITVLLVVAVTVFATNEYPTAGLWQVALYFVLGMIICGFINSLFHEIGHISAGKRNGFVLNSVAVWFFKWTVVKGRKEFSFTFPKEEAGYTEMIPTATEDMDKRYKKMTFGGNVPAIIFMVIGIVPFILVGVLGGSKIPLPLFLTVAMFLPVSAYFFTGNMLPMINGGERNDGAVILGINRGEDSLKVAMSLLSVQAELYNGKTPAEIDEKYYFDLPQLPEDDINFIMLLDARYNYYLDKEDFENAKKTAERLASLEEDIPDRIEAEIKSELLYSAAINGEDDAADGLMYELDKFLNRRNSLTDLRIKLAYLHYVVKDDSAAAEFLARAEREAKKHPLRGVAAFEMKLFGRIAADLKNAEAEA